MCSRTIRSPLGWDGGRLQTRTQAQRPPTAVRFVLLRRLCDSETGKCARQQITSERLSSGEVEPFESLITSSPHDPITFKCSNLNPLCSWSLSARRSFGRVTNEFLSDGRKANLIIKAGSLQETLHRPGPPPLQTSPQNLTILSA